MAVLPLNPSDVVDRVLTRFGLTYDSSMVISIDAGGQTFLPVDTPIIAGELLSSYVELGQPATRQQIIQLADATVCPPDKKALEALAEQPPHCDLDTGPGNPFQAGVSAGSTAVGCSAVVRGERTPTISR